MRQRNEEKAARRAAFRAMSRDEKAEYLFTYYRWHFVLFLVVLLIAFSAVHRAVAKKEAVLYTAYINFAVGDELDGALSAGFLHAQGEDERRAEVYVYRSLYLSDDASPANHEYAYASRLKLLGAIEAKKLDVVLMNGEAYDILSQSGYLLDLQSLLGEDAALLDKLRGDLRENEVVVSDNALEYRLNEAETYEAVTVRETNALELSALPAFDGAGFSGTVYLGVVANSPRLPACRDYLAYLADGASGQS